MCDFNRYFRINCMKQNQPNERERERQKEYKNGRYSQCGSLNWQFCSSNGFLGNKRIHCCKCKYSRVSCLQKISIFLVIIGGVSFVRTLLLLFQIQTTLSFSFCLFGHTIKTGKCSQMWHPKCKQWQLCTRGKIANEQYIIKTTKFIFHLR